MFNTDENFMHNENANSQKEFIIDKLSAVLEIILTRTEPTKD